MKYYIGIDGGGTKTLIRLIDDKNKIIDTFATTGSNISSIGYESTNKILKKALNKILFDNNLEIKNCSGLCMGASGVDRKEEKVKIEKILKKIGFNKIKVVNDTKIALRTMTNKNFGIVIIAGTGSIVMGIDKENEVRAGGWGYKLGDEGSAYWIGLEGIKSVLNSYDKIFKETKLTKEILEFFKIKDPSSFIDIFYNNKVDKNKISEVSQIVDKVANEGDEIAINILKEGSERLGKQVLAVYNNLFSEKNESIPIILNGSVALNSKVFNKSLKSFLENKSDYFLIKEIKEDPSFGACKMAKEI